MKLLKHKKAAFGIISLAVLLSSLILLVAPKTALAESPQDKYIYHDGNNVALNWSPSTFGDYLEDKILDSNGEWIFCIEEAIHFETGTFSGQYVQSDTYKKLSLFKYWVDNFYEGAGDKYFIMQLGMWVITDGVKTSNYNGINIADIMPTFWSWYNANASHFDYEAIVWTNGNSQKTFQCKAWENFGWIELTKCSSNESISQGSPQFSLAGAQYGIFKSKADAAASKNAIQSLTTNDRGYAKSSDLQVGVYFVKETKAAPGFFLDKTGGDGSGIYEVSVLPKTTVTVNGGKVYDKPAFGTPEIIINKFDGEKAYSAENLPSGSATLAGAQFCVKYFDNTNGNSTGEAKRTWVFETKEDGKINLANANDYKIEGDDFYYDAGKIVFPIGTYFVTETKAPQGYLLNSDWSKTWIIGLDAAHASTTLNIDPANGLVVGDQVKRGDINFQKFDEATKKKMSNVAFLITSFNSKDEEIESHVIVTDENGNFDSSLYTHSTSTNKNDAALVDGTINDELLDAHAGVWFGESSAVNDGKGAFPYGRYEYKELACAANEGRQLVSGEFFISQNDYNIDFGSIDDPQFSIVTDSTSVVDGSKTALASGEIEINDKIQYYDALVDETFALTTTLYDKTTSEALQTKETTFVAENRFDSINVTFAVDTSNLSGHTLAFKNEVECEGRTVCIHNENLDDEDEEIQILTPQIGTFAKDAADEDQILFVGDEAKIVDTVNYSNLIPGKKYTLEGTLMQLDAAGEATPLLNSEGEAITSTVPLEPEDPKGAIDVEFEFSTLGFTEETKLVVFEVLSAEGEIVATHEDPSESSQTVTVVMPNLYSEIADDIDEDKKIERSEKTSVTDTIYFENLNPAHSYQLEGVIVNPETSEPILDDEGGQIAAEAEIDPETATGSTTLTYEFNSLNIEEDSAVAFTYLYYQDDEDEEAQEIAVSVDTEDENETFELYDEPEEPETPDEPDEPEEPESPEEPAPPNITTKLPPTFDMPASFIKYIVALAVFAAVVILVSSIKHKRAKRLEREERHDYFRNL